MLFRSEYRLISRGGSGVKNIICSERNGSVVAVRSVIDSDDVMFISKEGITIRTPVKDIRVIGRNTQGLKLMNLNSGDKVVAAAKIVKEEETEDHDLENNSSNDEVSKDERSEDERSSDNS